MNNPKKQTLIVTSAIAPAAGIPFLTLCDPRERLFQTYCSLICWIREESVANIVLCDSTGIDHPFQGLTEFAGEHRTGLEVLVFSGDHDAIRRCGKGYGEGEIMNHVLARSRFLGEDTPFYKVTGRVFIDNFAALHRRHQNQPVVFGLQDNIARWRKGLLKAARRCGLLSPCFRRLRNNYVATTFYKCTARYYRDHLAECFRLVDDRRGYFLERTFLSPLFDNGFDIFGREPSLVGYSGSKGCLYGSRDYPDEVKALAALLLGARFGVGPSQPSEITN